MISEGFSVTAFKIECVIRRKDVTPADVTDSARSQVSRVVMLIARLEIFRSSRCGMHFAQHFPGMLAPEAVPGFSQSEASWHFQLFSLLELPQLDCS